MQINDQARYRIRQALNFAESAVSLAKELVDTDERR